MEEETVRLTDEHVQEFLNKGSTFLRGKNISGKLERAEKVAWDSLDKIIDYLNGLEGDKSDSIEINSKI